MEHPFFRNLKFLAIYAGLWMLISGIHFAILLSYYQFSIATALLDGFTFNLTFSVLGIAIWYAMKYSEPKKFKIINYIINHLTISTVIMIIWLSSSMSLLSIWLSDNSDYLLFLHNSILWRIVSGMFLYLIMVLVYYLIIYYNNI